MYAMQNPYNSKHFTNNKLLQHYNHYQMGNPVDSTKRIIEQPYDQNRMIHTSSVHDLDNQIAASSVGKSEADLNNYEILVDNSDINPSSIKTPSSLYDHFQQQGAHYLKNSSSTNQTSVAPNASRKQSYNQLLNNHYFLDIPTTWGSTRAGNGSVANQARLNRVDHLPARSVGYSSISIAGSAPSSHSLAINDPSQQSRVSHTAPNKRSSLLNSSMRTPHGYDQPIVPRVTPKIVVGEDNNRSFRRHSSVYRRSKWLRDEPNLSLQNNDNPKIINHVPDLHVTEDILGDGIGQNQQTTVKNTMLSNQMDKSSKNRLYSQPSELVTKINRQLQRFQNPFGENNGLHSKNMAMEAVKTVQKYPSLQSINYSDKQQNRHNAMYGSTRCNHNNHIIREPTTIQRIFCVRHGERVDFAFGGNWTLKSFDYQGSYKRNNINLPSKIPNRLNPTQSFKGDCPLTEIGAFQARLTGQALHSQATLIDQCYSSPALRCIQTADSILKGIGLDKTVAIRIEPGLFEYLGWYERSGLPNLLTPMELSTMGYNIDLSYIPCIHMNQLNPKEHYLDFYNRSYKSVLHAIESTNRTGFSIMLCGHAATLEVCTRQLCGNAPRSYQEFNNVIRKVSYLGLNMCEKNPITDVWKLKEPPIPPIQHASNLGFDWKILL
ncbi:hypothetical protein GJ496_011451 [Pomphorhynchus laevis]|nr:hypothetical protein GJ496_011451 [Pomphorhynchus laevis]